MPNIVWAHGLEGSPEGFKVRSVREAGLVAIAPDGRGLVLAQRLPALQAAIADNPGCVLAGSSYGGLASAYLASTGAAISGLLLMAPALHYSESPVQDASTLMVPTSVPCAIVHGRQDDVVPHQASQALAQRCPHVALHLVDDDHRLTASMGLIVDLLRQLS